MERDFVLDAEQVFQIHLERMNWALFFLRKKDFFSFFKSQSKMKASWANFLCILQHLSSEQTVLIFQKYSYQKIFSDLSTELLLAEEEVRRALFRLKKEKYYLHQTFAQVEKPGFQFEKIV